MTKSASMDYMFVKLRNGNRLDIPYWRIESGKAGPCLLVLAAQHGNEVNGCEVIRRFVKDMTARLKKGKIIAVPFANIPALRNRRSHPDSGPEQRYMDTRQNMANSWPGKKLGNDVERLCHAIYEDIIKAQSVTHIVDIHCYSSPVAPTILFKTLHPENEKMAKIIPFPFALKIPDGAGFPKGMMTILGRKNIAVITLELRGQYGVDATEVKRGLLALSNIARYLRMTSGRPAVSGSPIISGPSLNSRFGRHVVVRTPISGLFVKADWLSGDYVRQGDYLGHVLSERTLATQEIIASINGRLKIYGGFRENMDVSIAAQHSYLDKGEPIAMIIPEKIPRRIRKA